MKKNILLLSNAYYPSIGGIENSLRHLAEEAKNNNDNVKIIVSDLSVPVGYPKKAIDEVEGVIVQRYQIAPLKNVFGKFLNLILSNYTLFKLLKSEFEKNSDTVVIARFHFAALLATKVGFNNVRYVVPSIVRNQLKAESKNTMVSKLVLKAKVFLHNIVQRKALRVCKNFVFSQSMLSQCKALANNTDSDYQITKPGVDERRFSPLCIADKQSQIDLLDLDSSKPIILFIGRFVKAKGADLLIQALAKVPDCQLVMVGEGEEKQKYLELVTNLGLGDRVKIFPPTKEVEKYYKIADIFAMTSNYEPLGQTILEALSSGLPLIAFKKSSEVDTATQELDIDEFVSYAENYTVTDLVIAMETAVNKLQTINPQIIHQVANEKFSWARLYKELVN
ncbi:MAG: glycosyltransferase family 4 protein [Pseudoalteromonas prydzensis]|uniref:Glycosyltransferase family 4 protein n=1 Tax=Pseudoalteromonas prydzensis TaxID=182141 RepID=A0ABR9FRA2_9GAMM|nr:glycosyltransferase family 4 protein [Pseudoalteromonas prydzensis]MBE0459365.1 glycosyltransferase family 4 protein [Pseudoalteromonas prydzensis]